MTDAVGRVWYFAYGSNLDPERFRTRIGPWADRRPATLAGYRLRFSRDVRSEGGGGAFLEPVAGETAHGAVFLIGHEQLAAMDEVELGTKRNVGGLGRRATVAVETPGGPVTAEMYTLPATGRYLAPSPAYLGHVLDGLRAVGHDEEVVRRVAATAAAEPLAKRDG